MTTVFKMIDAMVQHADAVREAFPGAFDPTPTDLTREQSDALLYMQVISWHVQNRLPHKVLRHMPALIKRGYVEARRGYDTAGPRVRLALKGGEPA